MLLLHPGQDGFIPGPILPESKLEEWGSVENHLHEATQPRQSSSLNGILLANLITE